MVPHSIPIWQKAGAFAVRILSSLWIGMKIAFRVGWPPAWKLPSIVSSLRVGGKLNCENRYCTPPTRISIWYSVVLQERMQGFGWFCACNHDLAVSVYDTLTANLLGHPRLQKLRLGLDLASKESQIRVFQCILYDFFWYYYESNEDSFTHFLFCCQINGLEKRKKKTFQ